LRVRKVQKQTGVIMGMRILKFQKSLIKDDAKVEFSTPGTVRVPMACLGKKNSYHRPKIKDIETVIRDAHRRYQKGKDEHGELDLSIDQRDFILEAEKELKD